MIILEHLADEMADALEWDWENDECGRVPTPGQAIMPAAQVAWACIEQLRAKLQDARNRLDTIRETHPEISLDHDIELIDAVLSPNCTNGEKGSQDG